MSPVPPLVPTPMKLTGDCKTDETIQTDVNDTLTLTFGLSNWDVKLNSLIGSLGLKYLFFNTAQ